MLHFFGTGDSAEVLGVASRSRVAIGFSDESSGDYPVVCSAVPSTGHGPANTVAETARSECPERGPGPSAAVGVDPAADEPHGAEEHDGPLGRSDLRRGDRAAAALAGDLPSEQPVGAVAAVLVVGTEALGSAIAAVVLRGGAGPQIADGGELPTEFFAVGGEVGGIRQFGYGATPLLLGSLAIGLSSLPGTPGNSRSQRCWELDWTPQAPRDWIEPATAA